jgi:hypothetical protein
MRALRFVRRATALTLLLLVCAAVQPSVAPASSGQHKPANLRSLWSQFPLDQSKGARKKAPKSTNAHPVRRQSTSGDGNPWILVAVAAAAAQMLLLGVAVVARRRRRQARPSHLSDATRTRWGLRANSFEGGRIMSQKNWFRREEKDADPQSAPAGELEGTDLPTKRIAAYTPAQAAGTSSNVQDDGDHDAAAEPESAPNRSAGQQVDAILQIARDTAAKLTADAAEEAERIRAEANAAATREVETARSRAASDREQAAKERADAEAYAARLRSEAEAAAEKLRADTEHEASSLLESARESARARVVSLQADAKRHEQRREQLLAVSRGMASEIERVLKGEDGSSLNGEPADQGRAVEPAHEDLGEALQPTAQNRSHSAASAGGGT